MALTEAQIVRFSRQILLREVGGKGQQRLLEGQVQVEGSGAALDEAVTYLAAGGSPLELPAGFAPSGFPVAPSAEPVLQAPGAHPLRLASRADPTAHVVLAGPGLAFRRPDACPACWSATLAALPAGPSQPVPGLGALAALCVQRLVLGWSDPHGLVRWTGERFQAATPRCAAHETASNPGSGGK